MAEVNIFLEQQDQLAELKAQVTHLEGKLAEADEEARLFEVLFEARCKLLEDTKRLGLCVCKQRDAALGEKAEMAAALRHIGEDAQALLKGRLHPTAEGWRGFAKVVVFDACAALSGEGKVRSHTHPPHTHLETTRFGGTCPNCGAVAGHMGTGGVCPAMKGE